MRDVAPMVKQLRVNAAQTAKAELDRLRSRLPQLDEDEFEEVSRTVKRVVDKLLHQPTVKIKELAASPDEVSYEIAIEELFGLTGGKDTTTGLARGDATGIKSAGRFEKNSLSGFCEKGNEQ